jgi:hypothetical protein
MRTRHENDLVSPEDRLGWIDDVDVPVDVDALVSGGLGRGRRKLAARRAMGVGAVAVLAVAAIGAVSLYRPSVLGAPGAPSTSAVATQLPSAGPTPTSVSKAPSATRPATGAYPTDSQVLNVIRGLLPKTFKQSAVQLNGNMDLGGTLTVTDSLGTAWIGGGAGNQEWSPYLVSSCKAPWCTITIVNGQKLVVSVDGEKPGQGIWYFLLRPDGTYVWLGQDSHFGGNGPATRPGRPLADAQVMAILTDPAWDTLLGSMPTGAPPSLGRGA